MIKVMRHYEANQRSLKTQADTLRLLIDVGRI
jgi:flagellar basal body rod protein FlgG